jgi:HAMP domain-containing protein
VAKNRIDGEHFEFDRNHKPMAEMLALEKELGTTYGQWEEGLATGSAQALAGLIWLVWKRNGREKSLAEILASDINLGDLAIEDGDAPDPTIPAAAKAALSSTGASTPARSRKS